MSVHYKFKSALEYDTVTFDGLHISVKDLKNAIIQQKRIGKNTDFDLQVTNAQTKEVYEDENVLIPKNTSLLIARIPTAAQTKSKQWEGYGGDATPPTKLDEGGPIAKAVDLSSLDAPEDDKIKAMMSQSTQDYDPSNYMKIRGANQMGAVPPNYRCYKCHQTGHWIKDCPLSKGPDPIEIKKSTGIPLSFMVPVEGPQVQGAMMTPNGSYAVPVLDHQTYTQKQAPQAPVQEAKPEIPEDLVCSICSDLLTDAVMIPCCGNSFCDECIRSFLLESEEHECPDCHEKDISPATLIPNRFLRNSVANFKNTTGYVKKLAYKQREETAEVKVKEAPSQPPAEATKVETEEKTVISEADSTEHAKTEEKEEVKLSPKTETETIPEGPPGVSPVESPKTQSISKRINSNREPRERSGNSRQHKHRSRDESPRRHHRNHRNSPYRDSGRSEERAGTPTVDEPGVSANSNYAPPDVRAYNAPPMMGMVPPMQGPPPNLPPGYANPPAPMGNFPPTNGPPPNFRLPPPGAPPYMPPGPYQVPPRPMFDTSRPPMSGPPPMYNPSYQGSRSHHRDYGMNDRRMRGRTPSGVIDDPLAAFNRMLREKDERERRAKRQRRSYSRSRSRSRSYSRSPRRLRSRSPRRRQSRSRSRSFSISRSRSRSFSGSLRGSPFRDFSPRHSPPRRRGPSRYRSPIRSPPRHRFKDSHQFRDRDYEHEHERDRERDYGGRDDRGYSREREHRGRDEREGVHHERERERDFAYYDGYDERGRGKGGGAAAGWGQHRGPPPPQPPEAYYQPEMQHPYAPPPPNRYPPREYPPFANKEPHGIPGMMAPRRYEDVPPPGVEEPPVPGLENARFEERFDRFPSPPREQKREEPKNKEKKKHDRSRTPERKRSPSLRRKSKSKDKESPEKHKKKKREVSSDRDKKNASDEEKSKKNKDRKKKKEKKDSDRKKRKDKKDKHKEKKHKDEAKDEVAHKEEEEQKEQEPSPERAEEAVEEQKQDLYDDMLSEGVDTNVMENYGKIKEGSVERDFEDQIPEKGEGLEPPKEYEDTEKDILELHPTDIDLKTELDVKNEMLVHLPEKSKWEVEEDVTLHSHTSPKDSGRLEMKSDKSGKVTNEVLKRAENAIFAKAINAIRPIEIKKISTDRAKLYSGEKDDEKDEEVEVKSVNAVSEDKSSDRKKIEAPSQPPVRLSVKERLGIKVDDDRVVKVDRNKSRSISPFTRRVHETNRNYGLGERRVEVVDRRRRERSRHRDRGNRRDFRRDEFSRRDRRDRGDVRRRDDKRRERSKSKSKTHHEEEKKEKRKRSRSRSDSDERKDKRKKKEKKVKKEKAKKHKEEDEEKKDEEKVDEAQRSKTVPEKRKPTIDEANFEPDYDLESESEKEEKREKKSEEKKSTSSSDSSESSTDDEKKRKKHKKHRKKRSRKDSSSSSTESESDSSDEDKERKRKKHKKKQKKRKKAKHK